MRILITGAGRAIGAATATELTRAGHQVVATARDVSLLDALDVDLRLPLDVTDDRSVAAALEAAGELDAVVNNAAVSGKGPLEDYPLDRLRAMYETNTIGPLRVVQGVAAGWRARGSGVIVNVSSIQGRVVLVEPGYTGPGMKPVDDHPGDPAYAELWAQWRGTDAKVTGDGGRTPPETVAAAVRAAIEDPATPLRVPVGVDSALVLGARDAMDDDAFEAAMRQVTGMTW